jgi:hypothetical protein
VSVRASTNANLAADSSKGSFPVKSGKTYVTGCKSGQLLPPSLRIAPLFCWFFQHYNSGTKFAPL